MPNLPLPEFDVSTVVFIGSFNPRIFHPSWFAAQKLLPAEEGSEANIEFINNDVAIFEADWFRLEVLTNRWSVRSLAAPAVEAIRDLALGTFHILEHTPIVRVGLNTQAHFTPFPDEFAWHEFGHRLAPKTEFWEPILQEPGTLTLTIEGVRPDNYEGHVQVRVEPSTRLANGITIDTNDEFRDLEATSANWALEVLRNEWEPYRSRAMRIREHLLTKALEVA